MSDLYPTPTRLALLDAVFDGAVYQSKRPPCEDFLRVPGARARAVTSRMQEMCRAGWVELGAVRTESTLWQLTDAGRQVLNALTTAESSTP